MSKEDIVIFYHGTNSDRLPGILRHGLDTSKGGTGNSLVSKTQGSTDFIESSQNKIHVTTDINTAKSYSKDGTVLAIKVTYAEAVKSFFEDTGNSKSNNVPFTNGSTAVSFITYSNIRADKIYIRQDSKLVLLQEHQPTLNMVKAISKMMEDAEQKAKNEDAYQKQVTTSAEHQNKSVSLNISDKIKLPVKDKNIHDSNSDAEWEDSSPRP